MLKSKKGRSERSTGHPTCYQHQAALRLDFAEQAIACSAWKTICSARNSGFYHCPAEFRASRNPMLLFRFVGSFVLQFRDRQFAASLVQLPPRITWFEHFSNLGWIEQFSTRESDHSKHRPGKTQATSNAPQIEPSPRRQINHYPSKYGLSTTRHSRVSPCFPPPPDSPRLSASKLLAPTLW